MDLKGGGAQKVSGLPDRSPKRSPIQQVPCGISVVGRKKLGTDDIVDGRGPKTDLEVLNDN